MSRTNYLEAFRQSFENCPREEDICGADSAVRPPTAPSPFPKHRTIELSALSKIDIETLFLIFHYGPNDFERFEAAQRLRSYGWRFHTKFLMWFKRNAEPRELTNDYELGDYIFFDSSELWNFRTMRDFKFEYKFKE